MPDFASSKHLVTDAKVPKRAYTLFSSWPFNSSLLSVPQSSFEFDETLYTRGWSSPEHSRTWTNSTELRLDTWLLSGESYKIEF
jgi:hypothetical protein